VWFARFPPQLSAEWVRSQGSSLWLAEDGSEACAYLRSSSKPLHPEVVLVRLRQTLTLPGEAHAQDADWHYVVATDVLPAQEADFNDWYDTEHLPGLAAVPGVAQAARYRVVEGPGPAYHAGYDLADRAAFNSPPWLAVRGTAWSSRVRPAFFNTRRTMYRRFA
jgi:hypothetical protein